jgi:hypothetical protein
MDITDYFDCIVCKFNGIKTELTSELAYQILKFNIDISQYNGLNRMLSNSPIYFPIVFFSNPIYILNQNISFSLTGVSNCKKIELAYDKIKLANTFNVNEFYPNLTMQLEVFEKPQFNDIKERLSINVTNNLQNIYWMYKENKCIGKNNYIHPVKAIGFEGKYGSNNIVIIKMNELLLHDFYKPKGFHKSENMYSLNHEQFECSQGVSKYFEIIEIIQEINPEYIEEKNNLSQIVCLKSVCHVNLII